MNAAERQRWLMDVHDVPEVLAELIASLERRVDELERRQEERDDHNRENQE